jgi:hypothetical protein
LKSLGSILTSNDHEVIDRCLWAECLSKLNGLMEQIDDNNYGGISVSREVCWALSNITAGNQQQVAKVIDSEIFKKVIDIALNTK